jgi:hypothetical protein
MRPRSSRARAAFGVAALSTAIAGAGAALAAAADSPAPAAGPAPVAAPPPAAPPAGAPAPAPAPKAKVRLGVTRTRLNVRAGRTARVSGRLAPGRAGRVVTLEQRAARGWKTLDKARTTATGRFVLSVRTRTADSHVVRLRFAGDPQTRGVVRRIGRLNAFRPALASWYGPGFYGGHLACGGRLSAGTVGVAHKTLPCGTSIVLRKGERMVRAAVVDRGPYVGAREFDLTAATKQRLGFGSTGTVLVAD